MSFSKDLRTLLTDELDSTEAETALYGTLARTALLLEFVRALVAARDVAALRTMCHGTVELHELTERYGVVPGALSAPADVPFDGCGPATGAVRAIAALGLLLVDREETAEDHLRIALAWLAHTGAVVGTPWPAGRRAPDCSFRSRTDAVVRALGADPYGATVVVWLLMLQGSEPSGGAAANIDVLLDRGDRGIRATLRCSTLRGLPVALVPDPRHMLLFTADARFRSGLETAWQTAGIPRRSTGRAVSRRTVLWSLSDVDGPVDHVQDISLTAAFTVVVDQMRRRNRPLRGPFTLGRLRGSVAVVGGVDTEGRMAGVSGYRNKLGAAAGLERVVVPADDLVPARDHAHGLQTSVVGVRTWREAARQSRKADRRAQLRLLAVCVIVLLVAWVGLGTLWQRQQHLQELREAAATASEKAYELAGADDPELGLLLAMASDDLADQAEEKTHVLDSIARDVSSLRRVLRPGQGQFKHLALSRSGAWGALSTTTGAVQVVATSTGETAWQQSGSGAELPYPGLFVNALAMSPDGRRVAFASSDLRLTVLENERGTWSVASRTGMGIVSHRGPLNIERNAIDHLAFTADGARIVAQSDRVGLLVFDAHQPATAPRRCPEPASLQAMYTTDRTVLLTKDREVVRVDLTTCARSVAFTAPADVHLAGAVEDDHLTAVGTREAQLLSLRPDRPEAVLSDRGPFTNVRLSPSGAEVTASTDSGTLGWGMTPGSQTFGFARPGPVVSSQDIVLRHTRSTAELHDAEGSPTQQAWTRFIGGTGSVAWAGDALVLRGGRTLDVVRGAAGLSHKELSAPETPHHLNVYPDGATTRQLATSRSGPWAAVLYEPEDGAEREVDVWNVVERRRTPVPSPKGNGLRHVAFVGTDLYLGYGNGDVRRFRFTDGAWRADGVRRLPASVVALGGGTSDRLYVVVSTASTARPSVVALRTPGLDLVGTKLLKGVTALAKVEVMRDGDVVVGSGAGELTFLTRDLAVRGSTSVGSLQFVLDLSEVPGQNQVLVSGRARSVTVDRRTLKLRAAWERGAPFLSSDASEDGGVMATYNFWTAGLVLWTLDEADLRKRVCALVGRDLTHEEWKRYVPAGQPYAPVCADPGGGSLRH